jgi:hypothetical protein
MKKLMLLGAGAVGYVLGAKAGRGRYDQIMAQAQKLRSNPTVQQKVDEAKHTAKHVAKDAAGTAKGAAGSAADKVRNRHDSTGTGYPTDSAGVGANGFGRGPEGS